MIAHYESFVDGDAGRCGAILHHLTPTSLRTRTVFRMGVDAPLYRVDHLIEHDGDVRNWSRFTYDSPTSTIRHEGTRSADGTVHIDDRPVPHLTGAVPSYADRLFLDLLLAGAADSISFSHFDEGAPQEGAETVVLRREASEPTDLADGTPVQAERIQLVASGRPTNAHWCVDGVVVKSDWCGAQSFRTDDLTTLLAGLDDEVAACIRDFAGQLV